MSDKGYTERDNYNRCVKCSIGRNESGASIGGILGEYTARVLTESGKMDTIATFWRCSNGGGWDLDGKKEPPCEQVYNLKPLPIAHELGIHKMTLLRMINRSHGYLYTLKELRQGYMDTGELPGKQGIKETPGISVKAPEDYNEAGERVIEKAEERVFDMKHPPEVFDTSGVEDVPF
jgi:hypothetical protein